MKPDNANKVGTAVVADRWQHPDNLKEGKRVQRVSD